MADFWNHKPPKLKIKFPEFDLDNLRCWVRRCNSFFKLCQIPDHLKMSYVSLHIKGKADYWYQCYVSDQITWDKFCVDICKRFGVEPMDKFRSVEQSEDMGVEEYVERFEKVMCDMLSAYPHLEEKFYVSCFIAGLKTEIKHSVNMHSPITLIDAFYLANLQEKYLTVLYKEEEEEAKEDEKREDHGHVLRFTD